MLILMTKHLRFYMMKPWLEVLILLIYVFVCLCLSLQHTSLSASRSEKGTGWSSRSLGARCRNSIALCSDEQPRIGNYRLLKTIGKGNFAKVKLARHILTGREVSFKKRPGAVVSRLLWKCFTAGHAGIDKPPVGVKWVKTVVWRARTQQHLVT